MNRQKCDRIGAACSHDWRIVNTLVNRMLGPAENPIFSLKCRKCGAEREARGYNALRALVNRISIE